MAQIPQYNREVAPQLTPTPYKRAYINPLAIDKGESLKGMTNAIDNINVALGEIQNRIDNTHLLELKNKDVEWQQAKLYDKENGYYYKTGKDAYGQSEALMQDYEKYMQDYINNTKMSPVARQRAIETVAHFKQNIMHNVSIHDYKEGINWANNEANIAKTNYINTAVNMRDNDEEIAKAIQSGYQIIEFQGEMQHLDQAAVNLEKMKYLSSVHESVLNAKIADNSLTAGQYFEQHKKEIMPDKIPHYIEAIKNNEVRYTASETAKSLVGMPLEDAYRYINNIKDPQERESALHYYSQYKRQEEDIQREKDNQISQSIMGEVFDLYDSGQSVTQIMARVNISDMSLDMKEKIYKNLELMDKLRGTGDGWADYNILLDMASSDHEMFLKINPATYNLNKEQYNKILEMQREGVNVKYTPEVKIKEAVKNITGFNMFTQHDMNTDEYKNELVKIISRAERLQGKAFDINNLDGGQLGALIQGFEYKDENEKNKALDETKEYYMKAKKNGEIYEFVAREYVDFRNQNKREPEPEEIYNMVKRGYVAIENEHKLTLGGKIDKIQALNDAINKTTPKYGETKVLTYFADTIVPQTSQKLGIKLTSVKGSRYREGDKGGHGQGRKLDISMSEHTDDEREKILREFLDNPCVSFIGTSDERLLKTFGNPPHPKIKDYRNYDKKYKAAHPGTKMNHINHIDIGLNTSFGGTEQGKKNTTQIAKTNLGGFQIDGNYESYNKITSNNGVKLEDSVRQALVKK